MPKTRRTLFYPATCLILVGIALYVAPQATLRMLLANHEYPETFVRFSGVLMLGLSVPVIHAIRRADSSSCGAALAAAIPMWLLILILYVQVHETAMIVVLAALGLGILLTGVTYLAERKPMASIRASSNA